MILLSKGTLMDFVPIEFWRGSNLLHIIRQFKVFSLLKNWTLESMEPLTTLGEGTEALTLRNAWPSLKTFEK